MITFIKIFSILNFTYKTSKRFRCAQRNSGLSRISIYSPYFYVVTAEEIDHGFGIKDIIKYRSRIEIVDGAYDYH